MIIAMLGFTLGPAAAGALFRWIALLASARDQVRCASGESSTRRAIALAVCQSVFHAGPWSVAAVVFFAFQVRSESWAPWFFGGFAVGFVFMSFVALQFLRARAKNSNPV